jgi:phage baseplate assembly protein W
MANNTRTFADINFNFTSHPSTADIVKNEDEEAVKGAIRNLISTKNFDRPFHPEIGCGIHNILFDNFSPLTIQLARKAVGDILRAYEPRAEILDIQVTSPQDSNELQITVVFRLINADNPLKVTTILNRTR